MLLQYGKSGGSDRLFDYPIAIEIYLPVVLVVAVRANRSTGAAGKLRYGGISKALPDTYQTCTLLSYRSVQILACLGHPAK